MDLVVLAPSATTAEREAVDAVLGPPASGWDGGVRDAGVDGRIARGGHAARARRDLLLPALQALQARAGWISRGGLAYVCRRLTVPPAEAYGVASFYHLLALEPRPAAVLHVCDDLACRLAGAEALVAEVARALPEGAWQRSPCLGLCERAPAAMATIAGEHPATLAAAPVSAAEAVALLAGRVPADGPITAVVPQAGDASLRLLARVGRVDPGDLGAYQASGGGAALARARELGPEGILAELDASRLVGRGGAAFPAGRKWAAVRAQPARPRYLVCNADESEPGTFKDRVLLEQDPFALLEGMIVCALAAGCDRGFIYLRGEYPLAAARVERAIGELRRAGWLGDGFDVELRRGGGAYICGEETALFNSIEGKRGEPRAKPPFPVQVGLFGKPTVVNNVETLACVPLIMTGGGAAFAAVGSGQSTGPKLFCVSGRVARPGLYEVPFGVTLRELLALAGGVAEGRPLASVLLGGAAGSFVGPEALDVPLTLEGARAAGATLGSGVVMVFDDGVDLLDLVRRVAQFFADESCGQCVPCRVGTVRQVEALARLERADGPAGRAAERAVLADLGQVMRDASICGLGQTAAAAVDSGLRLLDRPDGLDRRDS